MKIKRLKIVERTIKLILFYIYFYFTSVKLLDEDIHLDFREILKNKNNNLHYIEYI